LQTHLLRLLDGGGEYHRLGDALPRRSDLRVVVATNRRPTELKDDFCARFAVQVHLPGLNERREDVPLLARHILEEETRGRPDLRARFFEERPDGTSYARMDPAFVEALLRRRWTSHVRELRALLWASIRASSGRYLTAPPSMLAEPEEAGADAASPLESAEEISLAAIRESCEPSLQAIRAALVRHAGNQSKAYVELGLPSRFALYRLLRRHGIATGEGKGR
jgi:two-component system nitrogen regulation response regulator GlnG/two-component system response regulator HydG